MLVSRLPSSRHHHIITQRRQHTAIGTHLFARGDSMDEQDGRTGDDALLSDLDAANIDIIDDFQVCAPHLIRDPS